NLFVASRKPPSERVRRRWLSAESAPIGGAPAAPSSFSQSPRLSFSCVGATFSGNDATVGPSPSRSQIPLVRTALSADCKESAVIARPRPFGLFQLSLGLIANR